METDTPGFVVKSIIAAGSVLAVVTTALRGAFVSHSICGARAAKCVKSLKEELQELKEGQDEMHSELARGQEKFANVERYVVMIMGHLGIDASKVPKL